MVLTYSASRANLSDVSSCIGRGNGCSWNIFGYIFRIFLIKTLVYETGITFAFPELFENVFFVPVQRET